MGKSERNFIFSTKFSASFRFQISDWLVDFHTPGGVDRDGWQYAVDFPATYHAKKQFTDYVRRRRWYRKCRLTSSGPWHELGNSKIVDVSLQSQDANLIDSPITVWAVAANGDALMRRGVSQSSPFGVSWEHITSDHSLLSISCADNGKVWVVGKNGAAYFRYGISTENPQGDAWQQVESPNGVLFKQISAGSMGVWALDSVGCLAVRREISATFPEGSHWQVLPNIPNDPPHTEGTVGFKAISVGDEVWAISNSGFVCRRCGITKEQPAGTGWNLGINVSWKGEIF